ncbi:MAG: L-rhamnose mutarotase, partial [Muribaculaceae bacterium]|nr:L-rhamnose mutarotase [Muribaculaceae bacterium]
MQRFVLTLDLKDSPEAIARYEEAHRAGWPEILEGIRSVGIAAMDIYRLGTRMVMILEIPDGVD